MGNSSSSERPNASVRTATAEKVVDSDHGGQMATLTVFFEGTANPIGDMVTQIGLFADLTNAVDLRSASLDYQSENHQFKIAFDGCGVSNGVLGTIFATGLTDQCNAVCAHVRKLISPSQLSSPYLKVTVNIIGLSRGGVAAIYLGRMLGHYDPMFVSTNLMLFDPVPGNLITSSRFLDIFGVNTANSSMDLSRCKNINRVLALYPYVPLNDFDFHAPVFPRYPETAVVEEDAVLGCHQGALFYNKRRECILSFVRIKKWLTDCGTVLSADDVRVQRYDIPLSECIEHMKHELTITADARHEAEPVVRYAHSSPAGTVMYRHESGSALFLNKWHESLVDASTSSSTSTASTSTFCGIKGRDTGSSYQQKTPPLTSDDDGSGPYKRYLLEIRHPEGGGIFSSFR